VGGSVEAGSWATTNVEANIANQARLAVVTAKRAKVRTEASLSNKQAIRQGVESVRGQLWIRPTGRELQAGTDVVEWDGGYGLLVQADERNQRLPN